MICNQYCTSYKTGYFNFLFLVMSMYNRTAILVDVKQEATILWVVRTPVVGIYLAENDLQTLSIWTISKCTESKQPNIIDLGIACQTNGRFRKQLKSKVSFIVYACLRLKTSRWAILFLPDLFTNIATKLVLSVSSNLSRDQWNILCLKCTYWPTITWARWPN